MSTASRLLLLGLLALPAQAFAQQNFPSPDAAASALVDALGSERADATRLATLLGADWRDYIPIEGVERADVDAFLALYREQHALRRAGQRAYLQVGKDAWEWPIPLVSTAQGWSFDTQAGSETIRQRRIGRNELAVQQALLAYHDAQMDYAEADRDDDGVPEFAQQFVSSDGRHDGLYWAAEPGAAESPLGPLFGDDMPDGVWQGYRYRILTAQGPSAPGGVYDYRLGANMSRGFALIAWPAAYADSGVMSFMISHEGQIFEKDLGPDGDRQATGMARFDPDSSWQEAGEVAQP